MPQLVQITVLVGACIYLVACLLGHHSAPRALLPEPDLTALHASAARKMIERGRRAGADEVRRHVHRLEPVVPETTTEEAPARHRCN
jgi:hypothetical protein